MVKAQEGHQRIAEAILSGEEDAAEGAIRYHIGQCCNSLGSSKRPMSGVVVEYLDFPHMVHGFIRGIGEME